MFSKSGDKADEIAINVVPLTGVTTDSSTDNKYPGQAPKNAEKGERPILARDNTGLLNFLNDVSKFDNKRIGIDGEADALKLLGRIYHRILTYHIITRYAFFILPVAILLGIPLALFGTVYHDSTIKGVRTMGLFVWLEIIWCSLWVSKLFSKSLPPIFRTLAGAMSAGTRKHSLMLKALEIPLSILFWVIISWATIPVITAFNPINGETVFNSNFPWIRNLQKAFVASIPAVSILLIEKAIIQFITVNYHRTQFSARIQDGKRKMHLFELLYEASSVLHPVWGPKFLNDDYIINSGFISTVGKNVQELAAIQMAQPTRIFDDIGRLGTGVTSIFSNILAEVTGNRRTDARSAHSVVGFAIERTAGSEALARRVFYSLVDEGDEALYMRNIERVLGSQNGREVEEIFNALDKDSNGDVTLQEMTGMLIALSEDTQSMARSLHDVDRAIKALDRVLLCGVVIGAGLIYATFFSQDFFKQLNVYTTSLMSFSFAFAGTVTEFTGSCIFLFVKHPYDVGDRVEINNVDLIVEHISLLYTIFRRVDSNRTVQIPNIVNSGNWIENVTRSRAMSEQFVLSVSAMTSFAEIDALTEELKAFVTDPDNKRDFKSDIKVDLLTITDLGKLDLRVNLGYKGNWANEGLRMGKRSRFTCALLSALRKVGINAPGGGNVPLGDASRPAYSVSLTEEEGKVVREKWVEAKEEAKFVKAKKA